MILAKNELKKIFIYINNDVMPVMFDVSLCFMTSIVLHTQHIYNRTVSSYVVVFDLNEKKNQVPERGIEPRTAQISQKQ